MSEGNIDVKTYSDEVFLGKPVPVLSNVEFVRGDVNELKPGTVKVIYFLNTFYKGAFIVNEELTQLNERFGKEATFIAISVDAEKEKIEKLLTKIADGSCCDAVTKQVFRLNVPYVGWDNGKATAKAFCGVLNTSTLHTPQAFIVDATGNLVWRQSLLQNHKFSDTNFGDQLAAVLAGKAVAQPNGARPKIVDEGEAAGEGEGDMSLF
jgi:hypothetical protein